MSEHLVRSKTIRAQLLASMQSVSGKEMGIALAKEGGIAFIYVSQPIDQQAEMVRRVKGYKAGFVFSDSNLRSTDTLSDVLALKERTRHSTMPRSGCIWTHPRPFGKRSDD